MADTVRSIDTVGSDAPSTPPSMKSILRLILLFVLAATAAHAADATLIAAVRAADDERVAATRAADRTRLTAIYSDQLHYAHSSGTVDNKATQIEGVIKGPNHYERIDYKERTFLPVAPGIVLMKGRALFTMQPKDGGAKVFNDLNYLAVWREEAGKWRFLAWQSNKLPPADGATK